MESMDIQHNLSIPFPEEMVKNITIRHLKKGEYLVREGEKVDTLGYIAEGYLRTFQIDYNGNDITTNFHGPNTYCTSYYGFYARKQALDNIVAITDATIYLIGYDTLMTLYKNSLEINVAAREIIEQVCIQKDFRIAQMLKLDGKDKYLWFLEAYPDIIKVAQMNHISSFLGIKPETLSRIRRKVIS